MTKKLEQLFGFDQLEDPQDIPVVENMTVEETRTAIIEMDSTIDKIDHALPAIRDLAASDKELDDIADLAKQTTCVTKAIGIDIQVLKNLGLVEQRDDGKWVCPFDEIRAEFALKKVA